MITWCGYIQLNQHSNSLKKLHAYLSVIIWLCNEVLEFTSSLALPVVMAALWADSIPWNIEKYKLRYYFRVSGILLMSNFGWVYLFAPYISLSFICEDAKHIFEISTGRIVMSGHSTSISLGWCPQVDNPGNTMPLSSIYPSNSRALSLSDAFSVVPAVQFTRVHVPKTINSMADVSGHLPNARAEKLTRAWSFLNHNMHVSGQAP